MIQLVMFLLIINVGLLICIGMVTFENPFTVGVISALAVLNVIALTTAAILTHQNSMHAVGSLLTNLVPFAFALCAIALLLLTAGLTRDKRVGS